MLHCGQDSSRNHMSKMDLGEPTRADVSTVGARMGKELGKSALCLSGRHSPGQKGRVSSSVSKLALKAHWRRIQRQHAIGLVMPSHPTEEAGKRNRQTD